MGNIDPITYYYQRQHRWQTLRELEKMADADIEVKDDHDLENIAADVYSHLQLMADDVQHNLIDHAEDEMQEAEANMAAIRAYLNAKKDK